MPSPASPGPLLSIASDSPRAPLIYQLFNRLDCIPVTSWHPDEVEINGQGKTSIYTLSTTRLSYTERRTIVKWLLETRGMTTAQAELYLENPGIVIYAEGCTVSAPAVVGI